MDFINLLGATGLSDAIGKFIYNVMYKGWIMGWSDNWGVVGAFSVTVIMFTIFLKIIVSPFDFWQKQLIRSNAKKMEKMRPQLEKITKQCGSNRELLMQKQREIYKQHKYSTFGTCLPLIITLAIFFIVFGGFNSAVRMHNEAIYRNLDEIYHTEYNRVIEEYEGSGLSQEEIKNKAVEAAEKAVVDNYESERFLLTKNIFVSDTWKNPVPTGSEFTGTGLGKAGITGVDPVDYETTMRPLMEKYNDQWNGYLILPILVLALNILSMFLNKQPEQPAMAGQTEEQRKSQQAQMKVMQFVMPIIMLIFALFYSTAFTLYMFVNALMTLIFNLVFNIVTKRIDAKEKDRILSSTYK